MMDTEKILQYNNYYTKIIFDSRNNIYTGKIEGISDFINFEADSLTQAEEEFKSAVDDYLKFCEEVGKAPEITDNAILKKLA